MRSFSPFRYLNVHCLFRYLYAHCPFRYLYAHCPFIYLYAHCPFRYLYTHCPFRYLYAHCPFRYLYPHCPFYYMFNDSSSSFIVLPPWPFHPFLVISVLWALIVLLLFHTPFSNFIALFLVILKPSSNCIALSVIL